MAHSLWFLTIWVLCQFVGIRWWGGVKCERRRRQCEFYPSIAISSVWSSHWLYVSKFTRLRAVFRRQHSSCLVACEFYCSGSGCVGAAVGCPDFTVPRKAELKREGDRVTVTCQQDRTLSWQRKCVGTQWQGELGTCPGSYATGAVNQPPGPLPIGKSAPYYF